jgi:TPR repeat protein
MAALQRGDYAMAMRLIRPLAEQGDAGAQTDLGVIYDTGLGVPQDYAQAVVWYHKAADQGDAGALFNLGFTGEGFRARAPRAAPAPRREARDPRFSAVQEGNRASDVAQRPQCKREVKHCGDAGVLSEAKGEIVLSHGLEQRNRAFQMITCFDVLAGEPVG